MKDGKTRAACYVRTSTDREEQEGSFQLQKDYFINMIKDDPELELVDCYGDYGKSGVSAAHRPEFQRMIRDCEEHKIDVIYTKSVSRFARNISDLVETIQHLRELGVSIYFEKESLNTRERSSELFLHILGIIAQEESRSFGANVRLGLAVRMATGHPVGKTPYGFRRVDKEANWVIEEEQAKRIRLAFRMAASGS
ncbi:MAG: recombinase family protein, partial [Oscillospiraceae bacterium]|nr:recombinase family protein [Oscillospiraceae bacterium]